jgi:hypothetical protein
MFEIFYALFYVEVLAFENLEQLDLSYNQLSGSLTIQGKIVSN